MNQVIELQIWQFLCIYLLLIFVLLIMKKCKLDKGKLVLLASFKMTVQLVLAGLILAYIFKNPSLLLTLAYLLCMIK